MENIAVSVGSIIRNVKNGTRYRVLHIKSELIYLCQMDTTKLNIVMLSSKYILNSIINGDITLEQETNLVYDYNKLTSKQRDLYDTRLAIMKRITEAFGPTYLGLIGKGTKDEIEAILDETGISRSTLLRWVRKYLQSGFNIYSIVKMSSTKSRGGYGAYSYTKKAGKHSDSGLTYGIPITETVISHFREALDKYKSGRFMSYDKAYIWMLNTYYSTSVETDHGVEQQLFPAVERPTFKQFTYYAQQNLTQKEKDIIKTSAMEVRNNNRLLLSDVLYCVCGPCDRVQMDECEVDVSLVSMLREDQSIGRPIVYAMIDVYTRMILAIGIAFDNNSLVGMTNCFLNLAEDKVEYCAKYGITITEQQWPSGYLPNRILVDRGSEYTSHECSRIFNEINISKELVPAGTGSLKGSIEQWFHQMQSSQNAVLEGNGQISKRHDSKHHKESCLTIDQFTMILINYVIYHNTHIVEKYPLDADMITKGVPPIPASLWEYGIAKYGTPRKITNLQQYCYSLMLSQKAVITRKGIICNGLYYLNADDSDLLSAMYDAQNKRISFECRIDPRDVGSVYYLQNNQLQCAPLNTMKHGNASFVGLTLAEWQTIYKFINSQKRNNVITAIEHRAYLQKMNELIVQSAAKNFPSNASNITENRAYEKHFIQNRNSMYFLLCDFINKEIGVSPTTPENLDVTMNSEIVVVETDPSDTVSADNTKSIASAPITITDEDWISAVEAFNLRNYGV